jgi:serine/threonine protein kinase
MTENYSFSKKQLLKFSSLESTKSSKHKQEATETIPFEILQLLNSDPVPSVPPSSVSQNTSAPGLQEEVEQIGNYFVYEKPIGEGSHSKTFLAFADKNLQEFQGVLKLAKGGHEAQLFKEIECANYFFKKNLSHPHLITFLDSGQTTSGIPYILLEYLFDFPRKTRTVEEALCITAKIAEAVDYLHHQDIFHRDIKPENIKYQITENEIIPKLFDFGTFAFKNKSTENMACSPYFAAPEILLKIRGRESEEPCFLKADIFNLGMTFLGLLDFNPYFALEKHLEKKYPNIRLLIDKLIKIHQDSTPAFFEVIERFFKTKQVWSPSLEKDYRIPQQAHEQLLEQLFSFLKQILHLDPQKRPELPSVTTFFHTTFLKAFGIPIPTFLQQGASFLRSPNRSSTSKTPPQSSSFLPTESAPKTPLYTPIPSPSSSSFIANTPFSSSQRSEPLEVEESDSSNTPTRRLLLNPIEPNQQRFSPSQFKSSHTTTKPFAPVRSESETTRRFPSLIQADSSNTFLPPYSPYAYSPPSSAPSDTGWYYPQRPESDTHPYYFLPPESPSSLPASPGSDMEWYYLQSPESDIHHYSFCPLNQQLPPTLPSSPESSSYFPPEANPVLPLGSYWISQKPFKDQNTSQEFIAYGNQEKTSLIGILKIAKKGYETLLAPEIEFVAQNLKGKYSHKNSIRFLDSGVSPGGQPYLVKESLSEYPQKKMIPEEAFCVVAKISEVLTSLHQQGIFHRDLKPESIKYYISERQIIPKLCDFSNITTENKEKRTVLASPYFAAPEVLLNIRTRESDTIDFLKADIFSLGMTFLGLLNFNPYQIIEVYLEKKYPNIRLLIDKLIKIHKNASPSFFEVIEYYFKNKQTWSPSLEEQYQISSSSHEHFLQQILALLKQALHDDPQQRPDSATLTALLHSTFIKIFGQTIDTFLEQRARSCLPPPRCSSSPPSSSLFPSEKPQKALFLFQRGSPLLKEIQLEEKSHYQKFIVYKEREQLSIQGLLKVSKKGYEASLIQEMELAQYFLDGMLSHPHIIHFFEVGRSPTGQPYVLTEYVRDFSGHTLILEEAFCILAQIIDAVAYLHEKGMFHRDIKPESIHFQSTGSQVIPKLTDFESFSYYNRENRIAFQCSPYWAAS